MSEKDTRHALVDEYVDTRSGMYVARLRRHSDGHEHIAQIFIGHDSCPACGGVQHAGGRDIDPKAFVADVIEELAKSYEAMTAYAAKHGVSIRQCAK